MVEGLLAMWSFRLLTDGLSRFLELGEAVGAENGALPLGQEGYFRHRAALGADSGVHLAGRPPTEADEGAVVNVTFAEGRAPRLAGVAASRTMRRLVQQAATGEEGLLTGSEGEPFAAIAANKHLIKMGHWPLHLQ